MTDMKIVTVVIPNFNGMKYLEGCLSSLRKQTEQRFETILIDNGSEDGSVEYVRTHFPQEKSTLWCGAIDKEINAHSYIVPGLGDAGDLAYGQKD